MSEIIIVPIILRYRTFITFLTSRGDILISNSKPIISIAKKLFPAPIVSAIERIGVGI